MYKYRQLWHDRMRQMFKSSVFYEDPNGKINEFVNKYISITNPQSLYKLEAIFESSSESNSACEINFHIRLIKICQRALSVFNHQ